MDQLDAYRCAKLLLDQHGRAAPTHAAMRAEALQAAGDHAGRRAWTAISAAIDELGRTQRGPSEGLQ